MAAQICSAALDRRILVHQVAPRIRTIGRPSFAPSRPVLSPFLGPLPPTSHFPRALSLSPSPRGLTASASCGDSSGPRGVRQMPATSEYPFPVGDLAQEPRSKRSKTHGSAYSAVAAGYPPPSLVSPPDQGLFSPQMFTPDDHAMSGILPSVHSPPVSTALLPTDRTLASPSEIHGGSSSIGRSDTFSLAFAPARPTQVELPTPPQEKGPQLRLPSFESLGIANAHPDALSLQVEKIVLEPLLDLSHALRDPSLPSVSSPNLHSLGGECHVCSSPSNRNPGPHPDLAFLTPPEEPKELVWSAHNATASSEERRLSDGGAGDVPIPAVSQTTLGTSTAAVEGLSVDDVASAATPSTTQPDVFQAAIHTICESDSPAARGKKTNQILT